MTEEKKIAVVTGGTRGIGKEISQTLMEDGFQVVAIYSGNQKAAKAFEKETGGKAYKLDVCNFSECEKTVGKIIKDFGHVDALINNAGIVRDGILHKMDKESWYDVIDTNLNSCFTMCRTVLPVMRERGFGRIVNISSINGQKGQIGQANYAAAKAGMLGFTKALALENASKGITVNAVCPGYIETDMTASVSPDILESIVRSIPVGRMGKPGEIAALVAFLASDKASFITGATMSANGGQYMA